MTSWHTPVLRLHDTDDISFTSSLRVHATHFGATVVDQADRGRVDASSTFGAHQFHSPMTCMNAGTSTIRTSVASVRIASVRPSPNIRMNDTCAAISAANEIDITSAAAVTTRPDSSRT